MLCVVFVVVVACVVSPKLGFLPGKKKQTIGRWKCGNRFVRQWNSVRKMFYFYPNELIFSNRYRFNSLHFRSECKYVSHEAKIAQKTWQFSIFFLSYSVIRIYIRSHIADIKSCTHYKCNVFDKCNVFFLDLKTKCMKRTYHRLL